MRKVVRKFFEFVYNLNVQSKVFHVFKLKWNLILKVLLSFIVIQYTYNLIQFSQTQSWGHRIELIFQFCYTVHTVFLNQITPNRF